MVQTCVRKPFVEYLQGTVRWHFHKTSFDVWPSRICCWELSCNSKPRPHWKCRLIVQSRNEMKPPKGVSVKCCPTMTAALCTVGFGFLIPINFVSLHIFSILSSISSRYGQPLQTLCLYVDLIYSLPCIIRFLFLSKKNR